MTLSDNKIDMVDGGLVTMPCLCETDRLRSDQGYLINTCRLLLDQLVPYRTRSTGSLEPMILQHALCIMDD